MVNVGDIIIRQRGTKFIAGKNVRKGSDDTLYSAMAGVVSFANKRKRNFDGTRRLSKLVSVEPKAVKEKAVKEKKK